MQRIILITGANGNLGKVVVDTLSAEGHKILAVAGPGEIPKSVKEKTIELSDINLGVEAEAEKYVQSLIDRHPELDAAILLAGGFGMGHMESTNEEILDKLIALNFKTAFFVVKPLMAHFKKTGTGQFILMSARPAVNPGEGKNNLAYAISKSMLITLAEIINAEGRESGITASTIIPSILDTTPNRESMPDADFENWVKPEDVAKTISFILSDAGKILRQPVFKIYNKS